MTFESSLSNAATRIIASCGETCTFVGEYGSVSAAARISRAGDVNNMGIVELRNKIFFLASSVPDASRGDRVTDSGGDCWVLQDKSPIQTNKYVSVWNITEQRN